MPSPLLRRDFLRASGLAAWGAALPPRAWAAALPDRNAAAAAARLPRFLLVFLRGGYDAASLLVPVGSSFYAEVRPQIAIARPGQPGGAWPLTADWGLHPALAPSLGPLWQNRQLAFVPFAGTEDLTRSHFETQDSLEMGQPLAGARDFRSGFLGRLVAELGGAASPMAFTDQLPLVWRGPVPVPNMALGAVGKPAVDERQARLIQAMYGQSPLAAPVHEGFEVRAEVLARLQAEMDAASRSAQSPRGFEQTARRMAQLMRERFHLGFVDVGGWDTHVGQGAATGALASRFEELGRGLAGFAEALGEAAWAQTVVVVLSEFGRTLRENGNRGTDHGHGSVYWVLGGGLSGGRVVGAQVPVAAHTLFQNRDYPVLNDYRAVLGGLWARMYGLSGEALQRVFPQTTPQDLGLL